MDSLKSSLRVALYDADVFDKPGDLLIDRRVPGLVAVLMTVKDSIGNSASPDDLAPLRLSTPQLFEVAIRNGLDPGAEITSLRDEGLDGLFAITGTTFQVSSTFLSIDSFPDMRGTDGTVFAYVDKSVLFALRVDDLDEIDLQSLVDGYCTYLELEEPPPKIELWWRGHDAWDTITVRVTPEGASVEPGPVLAKLLDAD